MREMVPADEVRLPHVQQMAATLRARMPDLERRYGVHALWLFGSYVHGKQRTSSDLDVLVEFDRVPSLFEFVQLKRHLSDLLGIKVDLVMNSSLKPTIGRYIRQEAVPV